MFQEHSHRSNEKDCYSEKKQVADNYQDASRYGPIAPSKVRDMNTLVDS